jgi:putative membrane protein
VTAAVEEGGWRRLSARMLLIHPVQELPRAFPALIGVFAAGSRSGNGGLWAIGGVAIPIALGLVRWFTTRYRITEDRVEVRQGLLRQRLLAVSRDRVRSVDVTSHALHRLLGLTRVSVGTGRSDREGGGSIRLDGLTAGETETLREELLRRRAPTSVDAGTADAPVATDAPPEIELGRLDPRWVWYAPFTLSGALAIGAAIGFLLNAANEAGVGTDDVGPLRHIADQLERAPLALALVEIAAIVLVAIVIASTVGYVLSFWDFRLTRRPGGTLHVRRGLITTRSTTIEERRLHGVEISEPLLLRLVRGARCAAIAIGLRLGRGERGGSVLLPPAPSEVAERVGAAVVGTDAPLQCPVSEHGPAARRRRYTRALGAWALLAIVVAVVCALAGWPGWPWQVALALLPGAVALAADRYRSLGHAVAASRLVTRAGSLVRRRDVLSAHGIIGWNLERSFFQRRLGVTTLTATTAAGRQHYDVLDVELGEALRVAEELLPGLLAPFLDRAEPLTLSPRSRAAAVAGATPAARPATGR